MPQRGAARLRAGRGVSCRCSIQPESGPAGIASLCASEFARESAEQHLWWSGRRRAALLVNSRSVTGTPPLLWLEDSSVNELRQFQNGGAGGIALHANRPPQVTLA